MNFRIITYLNILAGVAIAAAAVADDALDGAGGLRPHPSTHLPVILMLF